MSCDIIGSSFISKMAVFFYSYLHKIKYSLLVLGPWVTWHFNHKIFKVEEIKSN